MTSVSEIMDLCRLCLVKEQVNVPIFECEEQVPPISDKISACLPVKVNKDDKLPKKICDGCSYKLEMLYQFHNTSVTAEKQLLTWLENESTKIDGISNYVLQQQKLPYQNVAFPFSEDTFEEAPQISVITSATQSDETENKRKRKMLNVPEQESTSAKMTKINSEPPQEEVSTLEPEQPGPSGLGKVIENTDLVVRVTEDKEDLFGKFKTEFGLKKSIVFLGSMRSLDPKFFTFHKEFLRKLDKTRVSEDNIVRSRRAKYKCSVCTYKFKTHVELDKHMNSAHGMTLEYSDEETMFSPKTIDKSKEIQKEDEMPLVMLAKTDAGDAQKTDENDEDALVVVRKQRKVRILSESSETSSVSSKTNSVASESTKKDLPKRPVVYECAICLVKVGVDIYREHLNEHGRTCLICMKREDDISMLEMHIAHHFEQNEKRKAEIEKEWTEKRKALERAKLESQANVESQKENPAEPAKNSNTTESPKPRTKNFTESNLKYKCTDCDSKFADCFQLKRHAIQAHKKTNVDKEEPPKNADKEEPPKNADTPASATPLPTSFRCKICNSRFPQKKLATEHYYNNHFKRMVDCSLCGKRVKSSEITQHRKNVHSFKVQSLATEATTTSVSTVLTCNVCMDVFMSLEALNEHKKFHEFITAENDRNNLAVNTGCESQNYIPLGQTTDSNVPAPPEPTNKKILESQNYIQLSIVPETASANLPSEPGKKDAQKIFLNFVPSTAQGTLAGGITPVVLATNANGENQPVLQLSLSNISAPVTTAVQNQVVANVVPESPVVQLSPVLRANNVQSPNTFYMKVASSDQGLVVNQTAPLFTSAPSTSQQSNQITAQTSATSQSLLHTALQKSAQPSTSQQVLPNVEPPAVAKPMQLCSNPGEPTKTKGKEATLAKKIPIQSTKVVIQSTPVRQKPKAPLVYYPTLIDGKQVFVPFLGATKPTQSTVTLKKPDGTLITKTLKKLNRGSVLKNTQSVASSTPKASTSNAPIVLNSLCGTTKNIQLKISKEKLKNMQTAVRQSLLTANIRNVLPKIKNSQNVETIEIPDDEEEEVVNAVDNIPGLQHEASVSDFVLTNVRTVTPEEESAETTATPSIQTMNSLVVTNDSLIVPSESLLSPTQSMVTFSQPTVTLNQTMTSLAEPSVTLYQPKAITSQPMIATTMDDLIIPHESIATTAVSPEPTEVASAATELPTSSQSDTTKSKGLIKCVPLSRLME